MGNDFVSGHLCLEHKGKYFSQYCEGLGRQTQDITIKKPFDVISR